MAAVIHDLPRGQDVILWLKNLSQVQQRDLEDYFARCNVVATKIWSNNPGVFKVFMEKDNAKKFVSIPDHVPVWS